MKVGDTKFNFKFNGSSVIKGLKDIESKLSSNVKKSEASTKAMGDMRKASHTLRNSMALIGIGSFTALILSAPKLAGSLAKIKIEAQLIAWSIGKHLKPVLDGIGLVLHGIRTGDWKEIKQGISDMFGGLKTAFTSAYQWIKKNIFGTLIDYFKTDLKDEIVNTFSNIATKIYEHLPSWMRGFVDWVGRISESIREKDWKKLWNTVLKEPFMWVWDNVIGKLSFINIVKNIVGAIWKRRGLIKSLFETLVNWAKVGAIIGTDIMDGFSQWVDDKKTIISNAFWGLIDTILGRNIIKPLPEFEGTSTTADDTFNQDLMKKLDGLKDNTEDIMSRSWYLNDSFNALCNEINSTNENISGSNDHLKFLADINNIERANYEKLVGINASIDAVGTYTNNLKSYMENSTSTGGETGGGGEGGEAGSGGGGFESGAGGEAIEEEFWNKASNTSFLHSEEVAGDTTVKKDLLLSWIGDMYNSVADWRSEFETAKANQDPRLLWYYTGSESDETQRLYFASEAGANQISGVNANELIPSAWITMNTPFAQPYYQTGGTIPYDGYFNLHAGERVINKGRNIDDQSNNVNINIDFDGANIAIDSSENINELAENVSHILAENQINMNY